jgi:steroid delta-isomerase-like uncharacterized protein
MAETTETTTSGEALEEQASAAKPRKRVSKRKAVEQHVRSYFEAMARRDAGAMAEHWRADGVEEVVPVGILRGRDEIRAFFEQTFAAIPDAATTLTRVVAGDRSAAAEWRLAGHFTGTSFQGIEPNGKPVELRGLDFIEIEDGAISSLTAYYDTATFARQVGMLPADGSGAERAMKGAFNALTKLRGALASRTGA